MQQYNSEFMINDPDYILNDLLFIGTCGACPEQYDVVYKSADDILYQVGYVRLRYGKLSCAFTDVGGEIIYRHEYDDDPFLGTFLDEEDRVLHLNNIALKIKQKLEDISHGYS